MLIINFKLRIMAITVKGIELEVDYDYTAGEAPIYNYGDGSGYPGSDPVVEIKTIEYKEVDIYEILDTFGGLDEVIEKIIEINSP